MVSTVTRSAWAADMSTLGEPAKFTYVVAEAPSSLGPTSATPGVTVVAADADRLLEMLSRTLFLPGSLAGMGYRGSGVVVLWLHGFVRGAPDIADDEIVHGLTSPAHCTVIVAGGPGTYSAVMPGMADGVGSAITVPLVS